MRADWMSSEADGLESVQACHRVKPTRGFPVPLLVHAITPHLEMRFFDLNLFIEEIQEAPI